MEPSSPRLLLLETSGRVGQVAVAVGPTLRARRLLDEAQRHARDLAPATAELLREQGWRARELHGVVVSRGPGSYTGLRVGLMSAKTLAYATGCALLLIDTFAVVAAQAPAEATLLDVLADAQQDKVYVQSFERDGDRWRARSALAVRPFAEWLAQRAATAWVTGPGLRKWAAQIPHGERLTAAECWEPGVESLLAAAWPRWQAGERDDAFKAEPLYLRPSSAEEQWRKRETKGP